MKTRLYPLLLLLAATACRSSATVPRQTRRDPTARLGTANRHTITESPTIEHAAPSVPLPPPAP